MSETAWLFWVAAALVAVILEVTSVNLVFVMLAVGAIAGALTALAGGGIPLQVLAFGVVSGAMLMVARPIGLKYLRRSAPPVATNVAALVGRDAEAITELSARGGQVKLAGEVWSARLQGPAVIPAGTDVRVVAIDGATAVVTPAPGALPPYGLPGSPPPQPRLQDPPSQLD